MTAVFSLVYLGESVQKPFVCQQCSVAEMPASTSTLPKKCNKAFNRFVRQALISQGNVILRSSSARGNVMLVSKQDAVKRNRLQMKEILHHPLQVV